MFAVDWLLWLNKENISNRQKRVCYNNICFPHDETGKGSGEGVKSGVRGPCVHQGRAGRGEAVPVITITVHVGSLDGPLDGCRIKEMAILLPRLPQMENFH